MPLKKTLQLWTCSLGSQRCLVSFRFLVFERWVKRYISFFSFPFFFKSSFPTLKLLAFPLPLVFIDKAQFRVRKIKENDLAGLHLQHRWRLWTLPWNQLCVCHWDHLLVLCQTLCKHNWLIWFWFHSRCKFLLALPQNILFVCHWNNLLALCHTLCKLT